VSERQHRVILKCAIRLAGYELGGSLQ
jgi:hypothetical protein